MHWRRISFGIKFGVVVCCVFSASSYEADAQVYPPTNVGYNRPNQQPFCVPAAQDVIADTQSHIFTVDGFAIDSYEWSDSGLPVALSEIFPMVVSPKSQAASSFNRAAMGFGFKVWTNMGGPPRSNLQSDNNEDFEIDYAQNKDALPGVISISYLWNKYTHGAPHPEFGGSDFNWIVAQNRTVEVDDIFDTKTDWKNGLANAIIAGLLKANQSHLEYRFAANDTIREVSDPTRWAITKCGLRVDTDTYGDVEYVDGAPGFLASWSSLKPYLRHGGLVDP